jgi:hypothetical protein
MRHTMGIISFLLSLGAVPAVATPIYYTIDFTLTSGSPPPISGSFFYDASTFTFTSFDVVWDGATFHLTASANATGFTSTTDPCYSGSTTGAQQVFLLLTTCATDANPTYYTGPPQWLADNNINPNGYTAFDFTTVPTTGPSSFNHVIFQYFNGTGTPISNTSGGFESTTPEPGSGALMLIGLCAVMRNASRRSRSR